MVVLKNLQIMPYAIASGVEHMRLDQCLLDQHYPNSPSTLRFYSWTPAAISLGYHQHHIPSHWPELAQKLGMDMVRRPSGGRAVVHKGDLTYALVTDCQNRSRSEVYKSICQFLIDGMAELGIELTYGQAGKGYIHNPSCFATATNADLVTADGLKVIGSAQLYRHQVVLQHGSIQIAPDRPLLQELFNQDVPVAGVRELMGYKHSTEDLITLIIQSLTKAAINIFEPR